MRATRRHRPPPAVPRGPGRPSPPRPGRPSARLRPGFSRFDLLGVVAVGVWIVLMVQLAARHRGVTAETELRPSAADIAAGFREGEEWHGIYHGDRKVGFIRISRESVEGGYGVDYWSVLKLRVLGREQRMDVHLTTLADAEFVLTRFDGRMQTATTDLAVRGTVRPVEDGSYQLDYVLDTAGTEQSGSMRLGQAPVLQADIRRALLAEDVSVGDRFQTHYFDPLSQQDRTVVLEYGGREEIMVMGEWVATHRVVQHLGDQRLVVWINDIGEALREELPFGLVGQRESRAQAMYGVIRGDEVADQEPLDLVQVASIPFTRPLPDLTRAARIDWLLAGLDPEHFDLDGGRQRAQAAADGVQLRILREPLDTALTVDEIQIDSELAPHLAPDPLIQSRAPEIVRTAAEIRGSETRVSAIVARVNRWVYDHLDKEGTIGIPSALEILESRRGDCNEHATLATALLRAAGVPARVASGLAYVGDGFYYHAWVEYWHNGWRTADPTWGQMPADLGHIRLVAGGLDRQVGLIELFGRISVELEDGAAPP